MNGTAAPLVVQETFSTGQSSRSYGLKIIAKNPLLMEAGSRQQNNLRRDRIDLLLPSDPSLREYPRAQGSRGRTLDVAWYSCRLNA